MRDVIQFSNLVEINPQTVVTGRSAPFIGMEDVSEDGRLLNVGRRSFADLSSGLSAFRDDDVLFAKITPCMENGKGAHVAGLKSDAGLGSTEFHVLRARRGVVPRYVFHWTQSKPFRRAAEAMMTGSAGQRRVPTEFFHRYMTPRFNFNEQQRIAEILDAVDMRIDLATAEYGKAKACGEALAQSLIPIDPNPRELGDGWDLLTLSEVVPSVEYGISSSLELGIEGIPTLRMNNLEGGKIRLHEVKVSVEAVPPDLLLQNRDVLFNRTNSLEHVGRTSLWRSEIPVATFASYLVRLNPDHRRLCPEYLVRWLNRPAVQQRIRRFATPGVHQVNINPTSLRRTLIELPIDVRRQQQIVAELDAIDALVSSLQSEHRRLLEFKQGLMEDLLSGRVPV